MHSSQLLILGNGFDLHCGLKSSYKDFFQSTILDTIGGRYGLQQMKAGVSGFWETLLFGYYTTFGKVNYNWCDIETIIKNTVLAIGNRNKGLAFEALESVKRREDPNEIKSVYGTIEHFIYINCMSIFYDTLYSGKTYSDNEAYSLLINRILQELHKFERGFCKYIKNNIVNPNNEKEYNTQYIVNAMNLLNTLTGFTDIRYETIDDIIERQEEAYYKPLSPTMYQSDWREKHILSQEFSNLHSVNILSFNYTALFDILGVQSPCLYNNVHGKLCMNKCAENCASCNIIFGIDDTVIQSQEENFELHKFSKTYRKMLIADAETSILPKIDNQMIEIKFYGHSLSEADYSYFQSIFDYYNLYENNKVSLIFYYSKGFEQTDEVYRIINTYGKTLSNKDQGKNLTHKLLLENRLKIIEVP
ncbi:MAG TPA: bacteriophage abortive infection AbiH family protein [Firmicutes bacterium]|nr:bacteriophage abortive infection AbiH family protein [Bacillota bacterium]